MFNSQQERDSAVRRAGLQVLRSACGVLALSAIAYSVAPRPNSMGRIYLITLLTMLKFYSYITAIEAGYRLHLAYYHIRAPKCFDEPWESKSVQEFWGSRWNLSIAQQLRNLLFKPLASRGYRKAGLLNMFLGSATLHILPVQQLGGNGRMMASTGVFFLLQPVLIAMERQFPNICTGRAWVQLALWGVAPLFALPVYHLM